MVRRFATPRAHRSFDQFVGRVGLVDVGHCALYVDPFEL